jgi:hypothetical protein
MHTQQNVGYHLIVSPPAPDRNQRFSDRAIVEIDWPRLLLEWLILGGVVCGALAWQFTRTGGSGGQPHTAERPNEQANKRRTPIDAETGKRTLSGFLAGFKDSTPSLRVRWRVVLAVPLCLLLLEVIVSFESAQWIVLAVSLCLLLSIAGIVWWLDRTASPAGLRAHTAAQCKEIDTTAAAEDHETKDSEPKEAIEKRYPELSEAQKTEVIQDVKRMMEVEKLFMAKTRSIN